MKPSPHLALETLFCRALLLSSPDATRAVMALGERLLARRIRIGGRPS